MSDGAARAEQRTEQFVQLLGEHERQLTAYILALVPDWHEAHDIAQNVRLQLWRQFDEFDPAKNFGAWARTIAHYQVLHYRTRAGRQKVHFSEQVMDAVAERAAADAPQTGPRQGALADCLNKLDDAQRRLVMRCYADGTTIRDVAEEEGQSYEALRKRVFRIRRSLHDCIQKTLREEGQS